MLFLLQFFRVVSAYLYQNHKQLISSPFTRWEKFFYNEILISFVGSSRNKSNATLLSISGNQGDKLKFLSCLNTFKEKSLVNSERTLWFHQTYSKVLKKPLSICKIKFFFFFFQNSWRIVDIYLCIYMRKHIQNIWFNALKYDLIILNNSN